MFDINNPHENQKILFKGADIKKAESAMILVHGRGATAESAISLTDQFDSDKYIYASPQAYGNSWYPRSFLSPVNENEPDLSSALNLIDKIIKDFNKHGIPDSEIILMGFSQGACLILEFAARNAKPYKAVIGLSGGLIGERIVRERYSGSFENHTVFLGCSDIDPNIPLERVNVTGEIILELGASLVKRIYSGMGHIINRDEIDFIKSIM